ncbi:MAG: phosphodiester glycosidase family protein [Polyangiaceae bacterium]
MHVAKVITRSAIGLLVVALAPACRCSREAPGDARNPQPSANAGEGASSTTARGREPQAVGSLGGYTYESRSFDLTKTSLKVIDLHMSRDLEGALASSKEGIAIVNGGFFDPEQRPLGLAMSDGVVLSPFRKSTGGVLLVVDGRASMFAVEEFSMPKPPPAHGFGIQCLPRLIVSGERNVTRDDGKHTERTALCVEGSATDGGSGGDRLRFVYARGARGGDGPTLAEFAQYLAGEKCRDALNLDGGPSAGFAYRRPDGQITAFNPRGAVRHAIVAETR